MMLAGTLNRRSGRVKLCGATSTSGDVRVGSSVGPWTVAIGSFPSTCWPVVSSLQRSNASDGLLNCRLKTVQARGLKSQATHCRPNRSAATPA